jgi:hypothetical protein
MLPVLKLDINYDFRELFFYMSHLVDVIRKGNIMHVGIAEVRTFSYSLIREELFKILMLPFGITEWSNPTSHPSFVVFSLTYILHEFFFCWSCIQYL